MKKIVCHFLLPICFIAASCSKDTPENDHDNGDLKEIINLGAEEKANCYIVQSPGIYQFEADNQINLGEGLPVPPQINPESAALVWQTEKGLISSVELVLKEGTPYVVFEVEEARGNALIAVYNSRKEIEWSWHIWMPEEEITSITSSSGYEVMNINLGAINNTPGDAQSYGMLYQWGRKDPMPAAATLTGNTSTLGAPLYDIQGNSVTISNSDWNSTQNNTIAYSIAHPTVCLSNYAQYANSRDWLKENESDDALWGNPQGDQKTSENIYVNKGKKTCYDPSPAGWRVPPADVFIHFTSSGGYAWTCNEFNVADVNNDGIINIADYNYGWHFMINDNTPSYFPAAARFDGSYAMLMGSVSGIWGNYWSNSPSSSMKGGALSVLAFQVKDMNGNDMTTVSPSASASKADAYSIRCVRDN